MYRNYIEQMKKFSSKVTIQHKQQHFFRTRSCNAHYNNSTLKSTKMCVLPGGPVDPVDPISPVLPVAPTIPVSPGNPGNPGCPVSP